MRKYSIMKEYFAVLAQLNALREFFPECQVLVGGSYALSFLLDSFKDRKISDYDFIVIGDIKTAKKKMENMVAIGAAHRCSYYNTRAYYMGTCNGKKCNILLAEFACPSSWDNNFNSSWSVAEAKHQYVRDALDCYQFPREKDINDLLLVYKETGIYSDTLHLNSKNFGDIMKLAMRTGKKHAPVVEVIRDLANIAAHL